MSPSYNIFNYNYRPAKSIERKILVELWKEIYGVTNSEACSYIGMGSIFFSDFRLVHKELGLKQMINIEREEDDEERFEFNQPYSCVTLKWGSSTEILPELEIDDKTIIWLDYEGNLQPYMFDDIDIIFSKMDPGSFYTFTCNLSLSRFYDQENHTYKVEDFKEVFEGLHPFDLKKEHLEKRNAPFLILEMLNNRINHNLKDRNSTREEEDKLVYLQMIFVKYQDGAPMFTTGGRLVRKKDLSTQEEKYLESLSYTRSEDDEPLDLRSPILTKQELNLLNSHLPSDKDEFMDNDEIKFIPEEEKSRYHEIYRYYPTYVEARNF